MKPIICPECISNYEKELLKQENAETSAVETDELSTGDNVKSFPEWKSYAYHILTDHPDSARVNWVISCVNDEIEKYKEQGKDLPASIKKLEDLIKGVKPQIAEVKVEESERPIQIDDRNWAEKLNELHGITQKEQEQVKKEEAKPKKKPHLSTPVLIGATLISIILAIVLYKFKQTTVSLVFIIITVLGIFLTLRRLGRKPNKS